MRVRKFFQGIKCAKSGSRSKKKHVVLLTVLEKITQGLESEKVRGLTNKIISRHPLQNRFQKILKSRWTLLAALSLAAVGQWFIVQTQASLTLFPALFFYAAAVYLWLCSFENEKTVFLNEKSFPIRWERTLFGLIFILAFVLRVYRLDEIPSGIYLDSSGPALYALRLIHEHIKPPFMLPAFAANPSYLVYLLAAWFEWFSPTQTNLFLFYVVFSLAALPLIYWTFRQLAGPRTALFTLYFIAIMRWHLVFSRMGFRGIQVPFYLFGTLAFLIYGLKRAKTWPLVVSALFLAGGLYTYQSFKAVPLLVLILLANEYLQNPKVMKAVKGPLLASAGLALLISLPLLAYWVGQGSLGTRESQLFIGKEVVEQKSLEPLVDKITQTTLMFNRKGEEQPRHNFRDHRILDDVTGLFFVLGFFYALWRFRQRPYFYAVSGFLVMILPGLLSSEATQSQRMLGALPFTAFFTAAAFLTAMDGVGRLFPQRRSWVKGAATALLLFAALENLKTYFVDQAGDYDCWKHFNIEATTVGKTIVQHPDTVYYLAPAFYDHFTVQYLAYFQSSRVHRLDFGQMKGHPLDNHLSKVCFVLDQGKSPTQDFLKGLYPTGQEEPFKDRDGVSLAFFYELPSPVPPIAFHRGLERLQNADGAVDLIDSGRIPDPLINFTNLGDFGVSYPPFWADWKGEIQAPATGAYGFLLLTGEKGRLDLDGRKVVDTLQGHSGSIRLAAGSHELHLYCVRNENPDVALDFHLLWKKPGEAHYEVVPNSAFGKIQ